MKLNRRVYWILGAILIASILGICWFVSWQEREQSTSGNEHQGEVNNDLGATEYELEPLNKSISLHEIIQKIKEKEIKNLQEIKDAEANELVDLYEYEGLEKALAISEGNSESEYTEIWLFKSSSKDDAQEIFAKFQERMETSDKVRGLLRDAQNNAQNDKSNDTQNMIMKQESDVIIIVFSEKAPVIENVIDEVIKSIEGDDGVINVNAEGKVNETQTMNDDVTVSVKVTGSEIVDVEVFGNYEGIYNSNQNGIEANKKEGTNKEGASNETANNESSNNEAITEYEANIKFADIDGNNGTYEISAIITDANGNQKYITLPSVTYIKNAVSNAMAQRKEDGKISVMVDALSGGEILVTTTKDKPSANNANWQKYEADKVYEIEPANENQEKVYVWYKAGNEIALANEGVQVVADGTSNILMHRGGTGTGATATDYIIGSDVRNETAYASSLVSTITILDNMNIPAGADSWDVSSYHNGSIMAWITDDNSDGMYDLFIGSNGNMVATSGHCLFTKYSKCTAINNLSLISFTDTAWDMYAMFRYCSSLTILDLTGLNTANITRMAQMFYNCSNLTSVVLTGIDTSNVTNMEGMFYNCSKLTTLDVSNFKTSKVDNMRGMFTGCTSLTSLKLNKSETEIFDTSSVTNMSRMFEKCSSLTSLDVSKFNTSNAEDMTYMFLECKKLTTLNVSGWNTVNVKSMSGFFQSCTNLTSLDVSNFNTSNVEIFNSMFMNCWTLTTLDVSGFNTSNAKDMGYMFDQCNKVKVLDVSGFDTSKVTTMYTMFRNCKAVTNLDVSNFNTSSVTNIARMFIDVSGVTSLDLSSFDTTKVTNADNMFANCTKLTKVTLGSKFGKLDGATMFSSCTALKQIFSHATTPMTIGDSLGLAAGTTLWVPNPDVASKYGSITNATVKPIIALIGKNPVKLAVGSDYTDAGAKVLESTDSAVYTPYGYTMTASGTTVPTDTAGTKNITYTLNYTDSGKTPETKAVTTVIRKVEVKTAPTMMLRDFITEDYVEGTEVGAHQDKYGNVGAEKVNSYYALGALRAEQNGVIEDKEKYTADKIAKIEFINTNETNAPITYADTWYVDASVNGTDIQAWVVETGTNTEMYNLIIGSYAKILANTYSNDLFRQYRACTEIKGLSNLDTSNVTYMNAMFNNCNSIVNLDLSSFDTSKVTRMDYMFCYCTSLTSLKLNKSETEIFDTSSVTNMGYMFSRCVVLTSLDVSKFATNDVTTMEGMFYNCKVVTSLNVSNFNTDNVTNMHSMFGDCETLNKLDVSNFNTSNVTDMSYMFYDCINLTSLKLNKSETEIFDTSKVTRMNLMFCMCEKLLSLDVSKFNTSNVTNMQSMFSNCNTLKELDVSNFNTSNVTKMNHMFHSCRALTNLDVLNFNTSKVTNMEHMFSACTALTSLDLSSFNTSKVTNMANMFNQCTQLTSLDVSNFDTSSVTDMNRMFRTCSSVTELDLSSFDTTSVTTAAGMEKMFGGCTNLESIVLGSKFDKLIGSAMFEECGKLKLIFSHAETAMNIGSGIGVNSNMTLYVPNGSVVASYADQTNASAFGAIKPIIALIGKNPINVAKGSTYTDAGAKVLESTDSSVYTPYGYTMTASGTTVPTDTVGTKNITYTLNYTDSGKTPETKAVTTVIRNIEVKTVPIIMAREQESDGTTSYVLGSKTRNETQYSSDSVATITFVNNMDIPSGADNWDVSYANDGSIVAWVTDDDSDGKYDLYIGSEVGIKLNIGNVFFKSYSNCTAINNLSLIDFSQCTNMLEMFYNCNSLTSLDLTGMNTTNVSNMGWMFAGCSSLKKLDLSHFITDNVRAMYYMFYMCTSLESLNISNFNTGKVTSMEGMFTSCKELTKIDVSSFNTSNVTNMSGVFYSCNKLSELDLTNFNTSNVTKMDLMFYECDSLTSLNTEGFNTGKVTNMAQMFHGCESLKNLDLSHFITDNVTRMNYMFYLCTSLESLNISSFNTGKVEYIENMFNGCTALTKLDVSNFNTSNVTNMFGMFYNCAKLSELDLTNFNTSNVTDMAYMFAYSEALTKLDLSGFDTSKVTNMREMFSGCTGLETIVLGSKFNKISGPAMFIGATALRKVIAQSETIEMVSDLGASTNVSLYVPNTAEGTYETADAGAGNQFTAARIKPILALAGSNPVNVAYGATYLDAGATVAEYTTAQASNYTKFGYTLSNPVITNSNSQVISSIDTKVPGTYNIKYTLSYNRVNGKGEVIKDANGNTITIPNQTVQRTVVVNKIDITDGVLSITPSSFEYSGAAKVPTITVSKNENILKNGTDYDVSYNDNINIGTVIVTVTGKGIYEGTLTGSFEITKIAGSISYAKTSVSKTFGDGAFTNELTKTGDGTVTYSSNNTSVATVDSSSGAVTIKGAGSTTITATVADGATYAYATKTASYTLTVNPAILSGSVTISETAYYGTKLTANVNNPDGATITYQWYANSTKSTEGGTKISATKQSYTINSKGFNKYVYVEVKLQKANYETLTLKSNVTDYVGKMPVTITAGSASKVYDGSPLTNTEFTLSEKLPHSHTATVTMSSDSTITNVGTVVNVIDSVKLLSSSGAGVNSYYDITTVDGTLEVTKASGSISYATTELTKTHGSAAFTNALTKTGDGAVTYASSKTSVATVNESTGEVTLVGAGTATITATVTDGANYTYATKTASYTLTVKPMPKLMAREGYSTVENGQTIWHFDYALGASRAGQEDSKYLKYTNDVINTITFTTNMTIPDGVDSWSVSYTENDNSIMAWAVPVSGNEVIYDLYIGADGMIAATNGYYLFSGHVNCTAINNLTLLDTSEVIYMHSMFENCNKVTSLDVSKFVTNKVTHMVSMFEYCYALESLDLSNFNTSNIKDFDLMFKNCTNLKTLNISSFNTSSAESMHGMFYQCDSITSLDLSHFDTSKVMKMSSMFGWCDNLTSIELSNFNTSSVTSMREMFGGCKALTTLDVSNFDTSKVVDFEYFLQECKNLTNIDVSNFNTSSAKNMGSMFRNNPKLTSLDLSNFNTSSATSYRKMFQGSTGLKSLDLTSFDTTNVTNMQDMFLNCTGLEYVKLGAKFNQINGATMFSGCTALKQIFSHAETAMNIGDSTGITANNGVTLWVPNPDVVANYSGVANASAFVAIKPIIALIGKNPIKVAVSSDYTDEGAKVLESTDSAVYGAYGYTMTASGTTVPTDTVGTKNITYTLNYTDSGKTPATSAVTTVTRDIEIKTAPTMMQRDFITEDYVEGTEVGAHQHKYGDVGAERVTSFYALGALRAEQNGVIEDKEKYTSDKIAKIEFININETNAPTTYADTWYVDSSTSGTDIQAWVVETGTNTGMYNLIIGSYTKILANKYSSSLFRLYVNCTEIKGLSKLDTSNVTYMQGMFENCSSLTSLDLSSFNTSNVTIMEYMFYGCKSLTSLNISSFNTGNVTSMEGMFASCKSLTSLSISNFDTEDVTNMRAMFELCSSLTSLDVSNFKTSNVTTMRYMFNGCNNLTSLKLNKSETEIFDTSSVTNMGYMFSSCNSLTNLDVSEFNTSSVEVMECMFYSCKGLTTLDVTNFDTKNVTNMSNMFNNCLKLTTLDLTGFDTSNVTDMNRMFRFCSALGNLDLSSFDTSKITTAAGMEKMIAGCTNLESVVLGVNFKQINGSAMFGECPNLKQIFSHATTPMTVGSSLGLAAGTTLWVPNPDVASKYGNITNATVKPIIELIGNNPENIQRGETYADAGATVLESTDSSVYSKYGYTMTASATTVPTDTVGTKNIIYTLNYTDSGKTPETKVVTTITRDINVGVIRNYSFGGNFYETLADAYAAIKDNGKEGTIKVEAKTITDESELIIDADMKVTLDTNGNKIIKTVKTITNNGTFNIIGNGTIESELRYFIKSYGTLELDGANIINNKGTPMEPTVFIRIYGGLFKITSGYIDVINDSTRKIYTVCVTNAEMILEGGTVSNTGNKTYTVYLDDESNLKVSKGTISVNGSDTYAVFLMGNSNLEVVSGKIINISESRAIYADSGNILVTGGEIKSHNSYAIFTGGTNNLVIEGGIIEGARHAVRGNGTDCSVIIGKDDGTVSKDSPVLIGGTNAIKVDGTFNFYDGILKGGTAAYNVKPTEYPEGYDVFNSTEDISGTVYQTAVLKKLITTSGITAELEETSFEYTGKEITPTVIIKDGDTPLVLGEDYKVEYKEHINAGKATAVITGIGDYMATRELYFMITQTSGILELESSNGSLAYGTDEHTFGIKSTHGGSLSARSSVGNAGVVEGMIKVTGLSGLNAGDTVTVTVTVGETQNHKAVSKDYVIVVTAMNPVTLDVKVPSDFDYTYNGKAKEPKPIVSVNGKELVEEKDYTVKYSNNTNVGDAEIIVTGIGNYKDSFGTATFKINPIKITVKAGNAEKDYDGKALISSEYTVIGTLAEGHTLSAITGGSIIDVGTAENVIISVTISSINGDETDNYEITKQAGTLEVKKANMTGSVIIEGENRVGKILTAKVTVDVSTYNAVYKWYTALEEGETNQRTLISRANGNTLELTDAEVEKYIYLEVTISAKNYNNLVISDVTDGVLNESSKVLEALLPLMKEEKQDDVEAGYIFGKEDIEQRRDDIANITILNTQDTPNGEVVESWDISKENNDSVTVWVVKEGEEHHLYIGGLGKVTVSDGNHLFANYTNCTEIHGLEKLDTSMVTNMNSMFKGYTNVKSLNLSSFDTRNVTDMSNMFKDCTSVTSLDLSTFNTSNVENMSGMFENCSQMTSLNIKEFNTRKVTSISRMFYGCSELTSLDVTRFNTSKVEDMSYAFYGCKALSELDVHILITEKVTNMSNMFNGCADLTKLELRNFKTSQVENMSSMFEGCSKLAKLSLVRFDTSKVSDMSNMFKSCTKLADIDVTEFNTTAVTNMSSMFEGCSSLTGLNLVSFNTNALTASDAMFKGNSSLRTMLLGENFNKLVGANMFNGCNSLNSIIAQSESAIELGTNTGLKDLANAKIFVATSDIKESYNKATNYSNQLGEGRVKEILELIGDTEVTLNPGNEYTDAGVKVAEITKENAKEYMQYGYILDISGLPVDTSVEAEKQVVYTLKFGKIQK